MKNFWKEFKQFIMRGNVLDMAVGVIIASGFSAIVTALTNKILMPLINAILAPATGGEKIYTILWSSKLAHSASEVAQMDDAAKSALSAYTLGPDGGYYSKLFYIDWSAFIEAIINFLLIALVLFTITKIIIGINKKRLELKEKIKDSIKSSEADKENAVVEEVNAKPAPEVKPEVKDDEMVVLLREIRDSLKENKESK